MKRTIGVSILVFAINAFVISGVIAGVEPSPFQPQINQLYASENILNSIDHVVGKTMDNPPIEGQPSVNLDGALNKLDAANERVTSVSGFITSIYEEVMGTEPSPFRSDIVPALEAVEQAAQNIVIAIDSYLPPAGVPFEFIEALNEVAGSAQIIVQNTQRYIDGLNCTPLPVDCAGIHDQITCNDTCGSCIWVLDDTGGGECGEALP
jgi:hypothetical protein